MVLCCFHGIEALDQFEGIFGLCLQLIQILSPYTKKTVHSNILEFLYISKVSGVTMEVIKNLHAVGNIKFANDFLISLMK